MFPFILSMLILQFSWPVNVYIEQGNIWEHLFRDPVERVYIVYNLGQYLTITTCHENTIMVNCQALADMLEGTEWDLDNAIFIVHNHLNPSRFSSGDILCFRIFRRYGFKGIFAIYYPHNKTMRIARDTNDGRNR